MRSHQFNRKNVLSASSVKTLVHDLKNSYYILSVMCTIALWKLHINNKFDADVVFTVRSTYRCIQKTILVLDGHIEDGMYQCLVTLDERIKFNIEEAFTNTISDEFIVKIIGNIVQEVHEAINLIEGHNETYDGDDIGEEILDSLTSIDIAEEFKSCLLSGTYSFLSNSHKKIIVSVQMQGDLPLVIGTHLDFQRIISNLFKNAVEAIDRSCKDSGRITITLCMEEMHVVMKVVNTVSKNRSLSFSQDSRRQKGGIGIPSMLGLIERCGGDIFVSEDAEGQLVVVTVKFKVWKSGHIFLVDDNVLLCKALENLLRVSGFAVTSRTDAQSALNIIHHTRSSEFSIFLSDTMLDKRINGEILASSMRRIKPTVRRVLMTGHASLSTQVREVFHECWMKPVKDIATKLLREQVKYVIG